MSIKYMKKALATSLLLFFAGGIWALEPCPENTSIQWDNCVGTYTWANGNKYVGGWQDDKRHGQGTYTWANGRKFVGSYKDGKSHGQGTFTNADGLKFVGVWQDGRRLDGTYTWPNGDILETCPDDASNYQWDDYLQWDNCASEKKFGNEDVYFGGWQDGQMHGQGTYTWANGRKFVGEFQDGNKHGQGTFTWANGNKYVGGWQDDKRHGQGTWKAVEGDKYLGGWQDGQMHGQATYTWANGNKYVGGFQDDKRHGQGTFTWANGDLDNGKWRNDYKHGIFSHTRDGSTSDKNVFNMGEFIGRGDDSLKILETFCLAERDKEIRRTNYSYAILKDTKNYRLIAEQAAQDLKTSISNIEYDYENCIR